MKNEDNRRILYDWANGNFKSAKAVVVKEEIAIGDHYHNNKTEEFLLLQGEFKLLQIGLNMKHNVPAPYKIFIPRGVYHKFICTPGSILLGVATEEFDPTDEHKL